MIQSWNWAWTCPQAPEPAPGPGANRHPRGPPTARITHSLQQLSVDPLLWLTYLRLHRNKCIPRKIVFIRTSILSNSLLPLHIPIIYIDKSQKIRKQDTGFFYCCLAYSHPSPKLNCSHPLRNFSVCNLLLEVNLSIIQCLFK